MKCVFFGSPDFAVASLNALLASRHQVVGVVTQPDRPSGRGLKLEPPAVKVVAEKHGIPVYQPEKVNQEGTFVFLDQCAPDILAVVAYGEFLGGKLLSYCKQPPINVHPSLLPDLRGAAPMQWAVLRGYPRTGVTTQFMAKEMDAGDVLLQVPAELGPDETSKDVHDRLCLVGGELLARTLDELEAGTLRPTPQDGSKATFAPLLTKEQGLLRFSREDNTTLHNQVRGLFPWPGAYAFLNKKRVKVLRSKPSDKNSSSSIAPGDFWFEGGRLFVRCRAGSLELLEIQPEGKKPMLPGEFENGIKNLPPRFDPETP